MLLVNRYTGLVDFQPHRTENWLGEDWVAASEEQALEILSNPYGCVCTVLEDDQIQVVPILAPLSSPSAQQDTDALMVDHEYRLTLLELGVK